MMLLMQILGADYDPDPGGLTARKNEILGPIICMIVVFVPIFLLLIFRMMNKNKPLGMPDMRQPATTGVPSPTDGPGRYRVEGVDKESKMDTTWYCEAASAANAKVKAELTGIIVTSITRES